MKPPGQNVTIRAGVLPVLLILLGLGGCDAGRAQDEYEWQLRACSMAEGNGLLDAAVQSCCVALDIAEQQGYAPGVRAALLYRVGRLERQRGNFIPAEGLLRRSLALADPAADGAAVATGLLELALVLAGQDRWLEGLESLERARPLLAGLDSDQRRVAADVFRGFSVRLALLGHDEQAETCQAVARQLLGS